MAKLIKNYKGYESISRELIFDNTMSDRARFVYCYMMAKPDGWDFLIQPMAKELGYSPETLHKYINELIEHGWLSKGAQTTDDFGKFGAVEYIINDEPRKENTVTENTVTENTVTEKTRDGKKPPRENTVTEKTRHKK